MADLEKLITTGVASYGLEVIKSYPVQNFLNVDGYGYHVTFGDARGLKQWRLRFDSLPEDPNVVTVTLGDGTTQPLFPYIRDFFDRHHFPQVKPFIVTCPDDGKDYTAVFIDHSRSSTLFNFRLWNMGLAIIEFRSGNLTLEGMDEDNPNVI